MGGNVFMYVMFKVMTLSQPFSGASHDMAHLCINEIRV